MDSIARNVVLVAKNNYQKCNENQKVFEEFALRQAKLILETAMQQATRKPCHVDEKVLLNQNNT